MHFDPGLVTVVHEMEVLKCEIIDVCLLGVQLKVGEWMWVPLELLLQWLDVVRVNVSISEGVDKFTTLETTNLRQHARQQRVARDVEGHPESEIAGSLVHLTRKLSVG